MYVYIYIYIYIYIYVCMCVYMYIFLNINFCIILLYNNYVLLFKLILSISISEILETTSYILIICYTNVCICIYFFCLIHLYIYILRSVCMILCTFYCNVCTRL